jgi:hypothetical protein
MAKGRMINRVLTKSLKFNDGRLSDFDRLLFCLIIPFADRDGRQEGDAPIIKANCFARREDISRQMIADALKILDDVGLIGYYTVENEAFISISKFSENQTGFRYDREAVSTAPPDPSSIKSFDDKELNDEMDDDNSEIIIGEFEVEERNNFIEDYDEDESDEGLPLNHSGNDHSFWGEDIETATS